jgi:nucleoside-diphosphate-sugar epimerase
VKELVERVSDIVGKKVPVVWGERGYRWREMMEPWDVAETLPGWSPSVSLDDGLRSMWSALAASGGEPVEPG